MTIKLASSPVAVRWVRIWMTESSDTCDSHGAGDRRNCVGYAIRELYVGTVDESGQFHDLLRHTPDQDQTPTYCSSVDPWHAASDVDRSARAQVGFDVFYTSGYTRGLPAMVPIALIYSTPEDAAAEIKYLENRHYPVSYVEMGEEPDGHYMLPEDYGALYVQFAAAIHRVDPTLKLGGPIFTGQNVDAPVPDVASRVLKLIETGTTAVVPDLWYYEVCNSLLTAERRGRAAPALISSLISDIERLADFLEASPTSPSLLMAAARESGLTAYDAAYLELARRRKLPLATLGAKMRAAAHKAGIEVLK